MISIIQCKAASMEKGQAAEKAKEEYRSQLDKTNNKQTLHYTSEMPAVFNVSSIFKTNKLPNILKYTI